MRIQHNIPAFNANRNLGINNNNASKAIEKLSTGFRINRASDDAAGLAISEKMRAQINGLSQAQDNAQDGISLVQTAEGNLEEVQNMLHRMRTLAVKAANGVLESDDSQKITDEITALRQEITAIATQKAEFNGKKLLNGSLDGTSASMVLQVGANGGQVISFTIGNMDAASLTLNGIDVSSVATASAAISTIDDALNAVSTQRSKLGAVQNRLEHSIKNLGVSEENLTAAESRIRDTDMAKTMMEYTKTNIFMQSSQAMLAQANQIPQGVLQLLG